MTTAVNRAEIRLENITHNVKQIQTFFQPHTRLMAVVKGNAYGHGLLDVSRHLQAIGIRYFAVSSMDDAVLMRCNGISGQILHIGVVEEERIAELIKYRITPSVCSYDFARKLSESLQSHGEKLPVHIRIDQGLGTVGIPIEEVYDAAREMLLLPGIMVEGLYTQIPEAYQTERDLVERSLAQFRMIAGQLKAEGLPDLILHAASSPMITGYPEACFDMVRVGIVLFGLPCIGSEQMNLRPVMRLQSGVVRVRTMRPGERFGYDGQMNESKERIVATVQIGYGDAHFLFSMCDGKVLIRGQHAKVIGRCTMDHLIADVTDIPGVVPGDEAVLIGQQGDREILAEEVAVWTGYNGLNAECVTMFGQGVPRVYVKGGE